MSRLYGEDAELYDIAFDWDVSAETNRLLERSDAKGGLLWHELERR